MLFVLWFQFDPEHMERVREMWKQFKYPDEVKVIGLAFVVNYLKQIGTKNNDRK